MFVWKLEKLLNGFEYEIIGNKDVDITTLVYDSRKVRSRLICLYGWSLLLMHMIFIDQVIEKGSPCDCDFSGCPFKRGYDLY